MSYGMEKLMLSADGDVMLYEVDGQILKNFDNLLEQFYEWKDTNCYNEQLFVKFLQMKCGKDSVKFIKNLGWFDDDHMPEECVNVKWYNF